MTALKTPVDDEFYKYDEFYRTISSINKIYHQSQHSLQLGAFDIGFQFGNKIFRSHLGVGLDGWQQCISDDVAFLGSIPNAECFDGFG